MNCFVYVLKSNKNGKFYIGQTNNLGKRVFLHNSGYSLATKNGVPWQLVFQKTFLSRAEAMQYERKLKSFKSHNYIEKIIKEAL